MNLCGLEIIFLIVYKKTIFDDNYSSERIVNFGVFQGSALRPLLIILNINDISLCLEHVKIHLIAGDTLIHATTRNLEDCKRKITVDLKIFITG